MANNEHDLSKRIPGGRQAVAAACVAGLLICGASRAETLDCTPIPSLPFVISEQGIWCLTGNGSTDVTSGYAIEIAVNNVTLDLNGYKLGGLSAGSASTAKGIYAADRKNLVIRNGIVRGFRVGIHIYGEQSEGNLIEHIQAEQNIDTGIHVNGVSNTVRRNRVIDTGRGESDGQTVSAVATGIRIGIASSTRILDNDIAGVRSSRFTSESAYATGIYLGDAAGTIVQGNRITEVSGDASAGRAYGIDSDRRVFLTHNRIAGIRHNGGNAYGTYCDGNCLVRGNAIVSITADPGNAYGVYFFDESGGYRDNVVGGVAPGGAAFTGGTDLGGNSAY